MIYERLSELSEKVVYRPQFALLAGSVEAGLVLSYLYFLAFSAENPRLKAGVIEVNSREWKALGLSRATIKKVEKILAEKNLVSVRRGIRCLRWTLHRDKIDSAVCQEKYKIGIVLFKRLLPLLGVKDSIFLGTIMRSRGGISIPQIRALSAVSKWDGDRIMVRLKSLNLIEKIKTKTFPVRCTWLINQITAKEFIHRELCGEMPAYANQALQRMQNEHFSVCKSSTSIRVVKEYKKEYKSKPGETGVPNKFGIKKISMPESVRRWVCYEARKRLGPDVAGIVARYENSWATGISKNKIDSALHRALGWASEVQNGNRGAVAAAVYAAILMGYDLHTPPTSDEWGSWLQQYDPSLVIEKIEKIIESNNKILTADGYRDIHEFRKLMRA